MKRGIFLGEGSSDRPLGGVVAELFSHHGVEIDVTAPDFERLPRVTTVADKVKATLSLTTEPPDLLIIHRDADSAGSSARREEIELAVTELNTNCDWLPVIPVRMTEAWLLLDEEAIRRTAGNPRGTMSLSLPAAHEVERRADPKAILREALVTASGSTGRRRSSVARRFNDHRRSLLERLDLTGPVKNLSGFEALVGEVNAVAT